MGLILFIYLLVNLKGTYFDQFFIHLAYVLCHLLIDLIKELSSKLSSRSVLPIKKIQKCWPFIRCLHNPFGYSVSTM